LADGSLEIERMNESSQLNPRIRLPARRESRAKGRTARVLLSLALMPLLACSSTRASESSASDAGGPIPECEAYASRYEACLSAAGSQEVAHHRAQATRDAFAAAVREGSGLAELRKTCAANLARLHCR
jgi:hypothetical protein